MTKEIISPHWNLPVFPFRPARFFEFPFFFPILARGINSSINQNRINSNPKAFLYIKRIETAMDRWEGA